MGRENGKRLQGKSEIDFKFDVYWGGNWQGPFNILNHWLTLDPISPIPCICRF